MQYTPIYLIMIPIFTSLLIYLIKDRRVKYLALGAQLLMTVLAVIYFARYRGAGFFDAPFFVIGGWHERIGISLAVDALSISFVFLTLFSWWMVLIYILDRYKTDYNLLFFLMFMQGVFLGILQTNDLFNMFVFVELTTIIVTILIAYKKSGNAFRAAIYYLLLNTSGVLAFLIGIIFLYNTFGTINIGFIRDHMHLFGDTTAVRFAYVLMMAGISVKAALFPVFTWLPKAHGSAQSSISALLSGLIVKGGLYLFIRINGMFAGANYNVSDFFFFIGATTALLGIFFALSQKDLKQMLAYSTISQVGLIVVGLSSSDLNVYYGGIYHIFNHAMFKILLFMGAGIIIKVFQTKYIDQLRGVFKSLPIVSIFMIIGMLAITGAPLLNGFISKSVILYGFQDQGLRYWILFIVNIGTATLFIKMSQIFFGEKRLDYVFSKWSQNIALMSLAFVCVLLGNFYIPLAQGFFGIDYSSIRVFSLGAFFDYGITLSVAYLIFWFVLRKDPVPVRKIRAFAISFETANYIFIGYIVLLTVFFAVI